MSAPINWFHRGTVGTTRQGRCDPPAGELPEEAEIAAVAGQNGHVAPRTVYRVGRTT